MTLIDVVGLVTKARESHKDQCTVTMDWTRVLGNVFDFDHSKEAETVSFVVAEIRPGMKGDVVVLAAVKKDYSAVCPIKTLQGVVVLPGALIEIKFTKGPNRWKVSQCSEPDRTFVESVRNHLDGTA